MHDFGERLREAAIRAGYKTDGTAAKAAGCERRAYGNYVNGRVPKDRTTLNRICRKFGVTPNHLFGFEIPDYQQEAAAIAERMTPDNRVLWFQYGRAITEKQPASRKLRLRRA